MPKYVLFSLKIVKIAKHWGLWPQIPLPPATGGSAHRPPHQSILHCEFFSLHLPTKHSFFRNQRKGLIFLKF